MPVKSLHGAFSLVFLNVKQLITVFTRSQTLMTITKKKRQAMATLEMRKPESMRLFSLIFATLTTADVVLALLGVA